MDEVETSSTLKTMLQSLCCNGGWSYGVFWSFDKGNSMLLTLEDAYYEEQMATVVANLLQQVHMLGEGIIGEVATTGKHKWILSDVHAGEWNSLAVGQDIVQDDSDFHFQFSSGVQTITLIPLESQGVVQFGSIQKIEENLQFLDQARRFFKEMENSHGLVQLENKPQSLSGENYELNAIFASLLSPGNSFAEGGSYMELMGDPCSLADLSSEIDYRRNSPLHFNSSYSYKQPQTAGQKAPVFSPCNPDTLCQQVFLQSSFFVKDSGANNAPCISTWSDEGSILTPFEQLFPSEGVIQMPMFTSMNGTKGLVNEGNCFPISSEEMMEDQFSAHLFLETEGELPETANNLHRLTEEFKLSDSATELSSLYAMDDRSQWCTPSSDHSLHRMETITRNDLLQSGGAEVSSAMVEGDITMVDPFKNPSNSFQSSITNAVIANGQAKYEISHDIGNDLFAGLGLNSGCTQAGAGGCREDCMKPGVSGGHSALNNCMSECVRELNVGSVSLPQRGLFSELGIEEFIHSETSSTTITNLEDQFSITKRRRVESSFSNSNQIQPAKLPCSVGRMNLVQAVHKQDRKYLLYEKDVVPKSQVGLWIDDSYSTNTEKAVATSSPKPEKHMKVRRKRTRPGESTRPRPKDRQQIQDRLKELRGIIPDGGKCSIDCLLDLTIKHMLFLQSITQYADKIKEAEEPKLIDSENGVALTDNSTGGQNGSGNATWACEAEGPFMSCPIKVWDLSTPSQMLIEMFCEDRGFFLEIADVIRGFGLNIWKGVMERQGDNIWSRFVVEKNKNIQHITRLDLMLSLIQLQQQTNMSGKDPVNQPNNAMDNRITLLDSCQQYLLPIRHQLSTSLQ